MSQLPPVQVAAFPTDRGAKAVRRQHVYGWRKLAGESWRFHNGIDLGGSEGVTNVRAICAGKIIRVQERTGYGNVICIEHSNDGVVPNNRPTFCTIYAHLHSFAPGIAVNQIVRAGQTIGKVGRSNGKPPNYQYANATSAHLHFEVVSTIRPPSKNGYPGGSSNPATRISYDPVPLFERKFGLDLGTPGRFVTHVPPTPEQDEAFRRDLRENPEARLTNVDLEDDTGFQVDEDDTPTNQQQDQAAQQQREAEPNQFTERLQAMTQGRTNPPRIKFDYSVISAPNAIDDRDFQARFAVDLQSLQISAPYDTFFSEINELKQASTLDLAQTVPVIGVFAAPDVIDGDQMVNLNELIFSRNQDEALYLQDESERPLASIEKFEFKVQQLSVGGPIGIPEAILSIKVHNPLVISKEHPRGKYLAALLRQGYTIKVQYGIHSDIAQNVGFGVKTRQFFISRTQVSINQDLTMNMTVFLVDAAFKLFNQMNIGESLPISPESVITSEDVDNALNRALEGESVSPAQRQQIRDNLNRAREHVNHSASTVGMNTTYDSSTQSFASVLHGAIRSQNFWEPEEEDNVPNIVMMNTIDALKSIQSIFLTKRFEQILTDACYKATDKNGTEFPAVNFGALTDRLISPEVKQIVNYVNLNNFAIGDSGLDRNVGESDVKRENVRFIYGNFNSRAGQMAGKPLSTFPVNISKIFNDLRSERDIGKFAGSLTSFLTSINRQMSDPGFYTPIVIDGKPKMKVPDIKFSLYPDSSNETDWIFYIYDQNEFTVNISSLLATLNDQQQRLTKEEIIAKLNEFKIPWFEMATKTSLIRGMSAETLADDLIATHTMQQAQQVRSTGRESDQLTLRGRVPAGISREFVQGRQRNEQIVNLPEVILPLKVTVDHWFIPSVPLFAHVYVFFPTNHFSGLFSIESIQQDLTSAQASTKLDLQLQVTGRNRA